MDDNQLVAIEARWKKATPGPWKWREEEKHIYSETCGEVVCDMEDAGVNLTPILNAPSDVRDLISAVHKLTAQLAEAEKKIEEIIKANHDIVRDNLSGTNVAADRDRWKARAEALINVVQTSNKLCSSCVLDGAKTLCPSFKLVGHGCGNWVFDESRFTAASTEATNNV
jgi:hypothetical protein